jgi:hypothetical protein
MARAERRHHRERLKKNRRVHWGRDLSQNPEVLARAINTPTPCSCWMCGNERRANGRTMQERRAAEMEIEDAST